MKKRGISLFLVVIMAFNFCVGDMEFDAQAATDYDKKVEEAESVKERASQRAKEMEKDLKELQDSKGDILKYVEKVDKKVAKVSKKMDKLEKEIKKSREQLVVLEDEYTSATNVQNDQYEKMKKRIKYMYENGGTGYMDVVFNAKDIGDLLNRSEYVEKISSYDTDLFTEYMSIKDDTEKKRSDMEWKVFEISSLQDDLKAEKTALNKMKKDKKKELKRLGSAIANTDSKLRTFNAQVAKQEQEINDLLLAKQREIEKKQAAQKAANASKPSGSNGGDTYAANAEGLRWPLRVPGRISSRFGARTSPTAGASTNHQGVDIAVAEGTPIVAAGDGTVVTATYGASAGNYIMLYHNNSMYTVYMHASSLAVSEGATVKAGDVIAYVGSTGVSTGAHLHFGISINGVYVDPLNYVTP